MTTGLPRPRILIVDDNPDLLELVSSRLAAWGYDAVTATTGEEGLRLAEEQVPDLILLDILMPTMKGYGVCAQLKATPQTARIPVIFLTALGLPDHIATGMNLGADDYLVKPFKPDVLRNRIKLCLMRHGRSPAGR